MRNLLVVLGLVGLMVACGPRAKVIKTEDLEKITTEIFLANAVQEYNDIDVDSLDIYEPIFNKYGYRATDMLHTIKMMTRRKSIRFSDILTFSITNLEKIYDSLDAIIVRQDTVEDRIRRYSQKLVFAADSIIVTKKSDTSKLTAYMDARKGEYRLTYSYKIDPLDSNRMLLLDYGYYDTLGGYHFGSSRYINRDRGQRYHETMNITIYNNYYNKLRLRLCNYQDKKMSRPNIRFDSVRVYYLMPLEEARDTFMRRMFNSEALFKRYTDVKKDSCTLSADSTRVTEG